MAKFTGRPNVSINRLGQTFTSNDKGELVIEDALLKEEVDVWVTLAQLVEVYGFKTGKTKEA